MLNWQTFYGLFIVHGTTLDSKFDYYFLQGDPVIRIVIYDLLQGLNIFLADLILIWRCWVLYGSSWRIASVLAGCLIIEIVSACALVVFDCTNQLFGSQKTAWIFIYYSITVVTNCLCTFLILYRIVRISGVLASLRTYRGIIEMLIESAFVYSVTYIVYLVVFGCKGSSPFPAGYELYPAVLSNSITGIAPTLIVARVMAGKTRPNDSWTRPSLSESLHFASAPHTRTGLSETGVDVEEGEVTPDHDLEPDRINTQGEEQP
ncbi:hypothetical protein BDZ89DRAFT_692247 [Hymenopellis radicata]|nr:hypothetical protein BDZ89DRAFT_692247 [Hymenopellis radicata]